ncbi:MAG TPA: hypothetical protein VFU15_06525 [Bacteroidia bacterium]|nr:hypothetical protein [Bacteroidia bacterium]
MSIAPKSVLESYFLTGEEPTQGQFATLIQSTANLIDDRYLLGLRTYDPTKNYLTGDTTIYGTALYVCTADTTGTFDPLKWSIVASLGAVDYMGTWDTQANDPALASGVGVKGIYYVVINASSNPDDNTTLDGINDWGTNDWAIFNGTAWQKVDNSQAPVSAAQVSFDPTASISSTDVQDAIVEVDGKFANKQDLLTLTPNYYPFADGAHSLANGVISNQTDGVAIDSGKVIRSSVAGKAQLDFGAGGDTFIVTTDGGGGAEGLLEIQPDSVYIGQTVGQMSIDDTSLNLVHPKIVFNSAQNNFVQLTASTVPYLDASQDLVSSSVTPTELGYLSGVTSALQTQIDSKVDLAGDTMTGPLVLSGDPSVANGAATKNYVDNADASIVTQVNTKVSKAGDTMTGPLILSGNPSLDFGAATKVYVDNADASIVTQVNTKVSKAGDTMTGPLILSGNPSLDFGAATKVYVDNGLLTKLSLSGGTMTGALTLNGDPSSSLEAATKNYVDNADASIVTQVNTKVSKAGDTMTGPLILSGNPSLDFGAATKVYVDNGLLTKLSLSGGTMTGAITLPGDPSSALQAATKQYADTKVPLAGGTMTGNLVLFSTGTPPTDASATSKAYVNSLIGGIPAQVKVISLPFTFDGAYSISTPVDTWGRVPLEITTPFTNDVFPGATTITGKLTIDYSTSTNSTTGRVCLLEWHNGLAVFNPVSGTDNAVAATNASWIRQSFSFSAGILNAATTYSIMIMRQGSSGSMLIESATLSITYS